MRRKSPSVLPCTIQVSRSLRANPAPHHTPMTSATALNLAASAHETTIAESYTVRISAVDLHSDAVANAKRVAGIESARSAMLNTRQRIERASHIMKLAPARAMNPPAMPLKQAIISALAEPRACSVVKVAFAPTVFTFAASRAIGSAVPMIKKRIARVGPMNRNEDRRSGPRSAKSPSPTARALAMPRMRRDAATALTRTAITSAGIAAMSTCRGVAPAASNARNSEVNVATCAASNAVVSPKVINEIATEESANAPRSARQHAANRSRHEPPSSVSMTAVIRSDTDVRSPTRHAAIGQFQESNANARVVARSGEIKS